MHMQSWMEYTSARIHVFWGCIVAASMLQTSLRLEPVVSLIHQFVNWYIHRWKTVFHKSENASTNKRRSPTASGTPDNELGWGAVKTAEMGTTVIRRSDGGTTNPCPAWLKKPTKPENCRIRYSVWGVLGRAFRWVGRISQLFDQTWIRDDQRHLGQ